MPAWADQGEQQEGWLGGGAPTAPPKGGLPPTKATPAPGEPAPAAETTSAAAVWESDGMLGSATIPVDDSDPLPSMRRPDGNHTKMLLVALGLLLAVVCGLGYMLMRPTPKPRVAAPTEVVSTDKLMEKARAAAAKKNWKGAALEAESAVAILKTRPESKKELIGSQEFLASMYLKSGEFERAYKVYKELHNSTGDKKYAGSAQQAEKSRLKAIRLEASQKHKLAKSHLARGDTGNAIMEGLHAEQLYYDGKGSNAQKAAVCYTVGRAFQSQGANDRAEEYFKKAVQLDPSGGYYAALAEVRARLAPPSGPSSSYTVVQPEVIVVPSGPATRRPATRRPSTSTRPSKPAFHTPPPPPPPPRQTRVTPAVRKTPKPSGLNKFKSDNDPTRFKGY